MRLYTEDCNLERSAFPGDSSWRTEDAGTLRAAGLAVKTVTVAPPGTHSLEACETYERQWREIAPELVSLLKGAHGVAVIWARGPMESHGLPNLMPYIVGTNPWGDRYHVEAVTFTERHAFTDSWVSFEFCRESYERLMQDDWVDFETVRQYALFFDESAFAETLPQWFGNLGSQWVREHDAIALAHHRHFEGCDSIAGREEMLWALKRIALHFEIAG